MTMFAPEMRPKSRVLSIDELLGEIAEIERDFGSFSELEAKAERDRLTVEERAAYLRLDGLRFLAHAE